MYIFYIFTHIILQFARILRDVPLGFYKLKLCKFKCKFVHHKRPTKAIKPFALSLFGRIVSYRDLFICS